MLSKTDVACAAVHVANRHFIVKTRIQATCIQCLRTTDFGPGVHNSKLWTICATKGYYSASSNSAGIAANNVIRKVPIICTKLRLFTICSEVHFKLPINAVKGLYLDVPYGLKEITLHECHIRLSVLSSLTEYVID